MFKPLLRTLPSLSGNIKIACFLNDYKEIDEHVFETNIRSARLNTISSNLFDKYIYLSLIGSSYEWDVKTFYKKYSDYFYKSMFDYNKEDLPMYDENSSNIIRNVDFEYGASRISYQNFNKQFSFYAPIYIESENDIPDYFEIKIDLENNIYKAQRKIRVNIGNLDEPSNYLGNYIYDYAKKIDSNVVYFNKDDNEGIYYGIDVKHGGFSSNHDSRFQSLLTKQNSILNFDNIICKGFERNCLIMKQIIPLCFYFSVNDILSEIEKTMFYGSEIKVSGKWIKNNIECPFYDFDIDYSLFQPYIKSLNTENGGMDWKIPSLNSKPINIMNMGYPSMKEASYFKYRFANKISPSFCRWKLKYSDDEHPYITNISSAFSFYQNSKTKYGQFPSLYESSSGLVTKKPFYLNLFLPLNGGEKKYSNELLEKYKSTRNKFCSEWFETFSSIDDIAKKCVDVIDNKTYFKGMMFNLQDIYDRLPDDFGLISNITKFGVFVRPIFNFITDEQIRNENVYSNWTIIKENSKYLEGISSNCHINDNVLTDENPRMFSNMKTSVKKDALVENNIFVKNEEDNGDFVSLSNYNVDWWESNSFIRLEDLENKISNNILSNLKSKSNEGYEILPIYRLSNLITSGGTLPKYYSYFTTLYTSQGSSSSKMPIDEDIKITGTEYSNRFNINSLNFYRKGTFIDKEEAKKSIIESYISIVPNMHKGFSYSDSWKLIEKYSYDLISRSINNLCTYTFNPELKQNNETYSVRSFKSAYNFSSRFYGDNIRYYDDNSYTYTYMLDNDFLYVDPYNLNHIIDHYNNTWLKDDEPLSYYHYPTEFLGDFADEDVVYTAPFEWTWTNEDHHEVIAKLIDEYLQFYPTDMNPQNIEKKYEMSFKENLRFPSKRVFFYVPKNDGDFISPKCDTLEEIKEVYEKAKYYNPLTGLKFETPFEYNGKVYSWYDVAIAQKYLNEYEDDASYRNKNKQFVFAEMGLHKNKFGSSKNYIVMDHLNSKDVYVKFLNRLHLRYWLKQLWFNNPSISPNDSSYNITAFNNIYIRKRVIDANLNVKDAYIPLNEIFKTPEYGLEEDAAEELLSTIAYDEEYDMFYFKKLIFEEGKFYRMNDENKKEIRSQLLWWDIEKMYSYIYKTTGEVEKEFIPENFKFELVFKKLMIKVDDNIWRLINLEEKYAAPYKDLYLYELEHDHEYNQTSQIYPIDYINKNEEDSSNINYNLVYPGCILKPMFNLVRIETKDDSKIFTEYSINNITKSTLIDPMKLSGYDELHFYRHNCNNDIVMYDLSTINKNVPMMINGKKYVYKSHFPELPDSSYIHFHDTYDLFGKNNIEFSDSIPTYSYNVLVGTYIDKIPKALEIKGSYNCKAFKETFGDLYSSYFEEKLKNYGTYRYDDPEYTIIANNFPTKNIEFRMTSYTYIDVDEVKEIYEDRWTYTYYDDLKLYDKFGLSTYDWIDKDTGERNTYGFYMIDVNLNNTINTFNIITNEGDNLKYVSYINSLSVERESEDIMMLYKQLVPFIKNNPLRFLFQNSYGLMKPSLFNIPLDYHPVKKDNYYDIIFEKEKFGTTVCERYLDNVVPVLTEKNLLSTYNIKYKNKKQSFKLSYFTNEPIYKDDMSIYYYPGTRIYDIEKPNEYIVKNDIEWKHFNSNKYINLEEKFEYSYDDLLTKAEVQIAESDSQVFSIFRECILEHTMSTLDENEIEWAYKKYKKSFECESIKLDITQSEKLYSLKIVFELF